MNFKEAVDIAVSLMDEVPLKGSDSRIRAMAQLKLQQSVDIAEKAIKREESKKV